MPAPTEALRRESEIARCLSHAATVDYSELRFVRGMCNLLGAVVHAERTGATAEAALALLTRAQNAGNLQQEIWALRCKALCVLHMDRPREAIDLLRLITAAMPGSVDLAAQISANGALALALSRLGKHAASFDAVASTIELLERVRRPSSHSIIVGISGALEVLLRGREAGIADQFDDWMGWEKRALGELRRYCRVFPVGQAQLGLWTGLDHWIEGRRDRAMAVWRRALANARALSLRKDETLVAAEIRRREAVRA